jgi:hypothetical protein
VPVRFRHPKPANGISLEVELDQYRRLVPDHPPVVPRVDRNDHRSHQLQGAPVRVLNVDVAASPEPDVRMQRSVPTGVFM